MKTTIDIADDLIGRARLIQKRDDVTLRTLVEEGLRLVLDKHAKPAKPYKFEPVIVGEPYRPGMPVIDVNALIAEGYAERESRMLAGAFEESATRSGLRVAEPRPAYDAKPKRVRTVRRKRG